MNVAIDSLELAADGIGADNVAATLLVDDEAYVCVENVDLNVVTDDSVVS